MKNYLVVLLVFLFVSLGSCQAPQNKKITLCFVGDVMLGRQVGNMIQNTHDPAWPFRKINSELAASDICVANLECVWVDKLILNADPKAPILLPAFGNTVQGLTLASVDVISIVNNHSLDYGTEGLQQTLDILQEHKIDSMGLIDNTPVRISCEGVEIAFYGIGCKDNQFYQVSATHGYKRMDINYLMENIAQEKSKSDCVVLSIHWEDSLDTHPSLFQKKVARLAIDSGVDLVIGQGTHQVQTIEKYKNGLIAYSLGNFIFDQKYSVTQNGIILKCYYKKGKGLIDADISGTIINQKTQYQVEKTGAVQKLF